MSYQRDWDAKLLIMLTTYTASTNDIMGLISANIVSHRGFCPLCNLLVLLQPPVQGVLEGE
jgi:hypothetical protein